MNISMTKCTVITKLWPTFIGNTSFILLNLILWKANAELWKRWHRGLNIFSLSSKLYTHEKQKAVHLQCRGQRNWQSGYHAISVPCLLTLWGNLYSWPPQWKSGSNSVADGLVLGAYINPWSQSWKRKQVANDHGERLRAASALPLRCSGIMLLGASCWGGVGKHVRLCVSQLSITITNIWDNQFIRKFNLTLLGRPCLFWDWWQRTS